MLHVRRREFIALLGGGAVAWPLAARAQQSAPMVGFLHSGLPEPLAHLVASFRQGLSEAGYVEGQNVRIEYRWARGQYDQIPALAAELVKQQVNVIVAGGGEVTALAVKAATSTIPVVFALAGDPVRFGLVESLARPGGNLTGLNAFTSVVEAKKFGLLHELLPHVNVVAMLINPSFPPAETDAKEVEAAAQTIGTKVEVLRASKEHEFEPAFVTISKQNIGGLLVAGDPFFNSRREQLAGLSVRYRLPAIFEFREYALAGGLMSYGIDLPDNYRRIGIYAGRILRGADPADLPVMQPTKFIFTINLKTAKTLGLEVPPTLLALADEVIE
jgi:putative ABC transport system substrate-binding protein